MFGIEPTLRPRDWSALHALDAPLAALASSGPLYVGRDVVCAAPNCSSGSSTPGDVTTSTLIVCTCAENHPLLSAALRWAPLGQAHDQLTEAEHTLDLTGLHPTRRTNARKALLAAALTLTDATASATYASAWERATLNALSVRAEAARSRLWRRPLALLTGKTHWVLVKQLNARPVLANGHDGATVRRVAAVSELLHAAPGWEHVVIRTTRGRDWWSDHGHPGGWAMLDPVKGSVQPEVWHLFDALLATQVAPQIALNLAIRLARETPTAQLEVLVPLLNSGLTLADAQEAAHGIAS